MTFLLKAEKWYLNVLLFILCQPNAKEVIDFLCNTVNKFPSKWGQLAILCTTCTSLDILWFFFFFQGKSKENLALIYTMGSNGDETVTMEDFTRIEKIGEGMSSCT